VKQQAFERDRGDAWEAFRVQLEGISRGYRLSDGVSAVEFVANYREACRDLALAKSRGYSHMLVARLNELVIQGHNAVYVRRSGYLRSVINFVRADFPRLVRDAGSYVLVSTLLFFGTGNSSIASSRRTRLRASKVCTTQAPAGLAASASPTLISTCSVFTS
jgi:hypothetical protein